MRLDYFVVFPNGEQRINEVLQILQQYDDLEIIWLDKYEPDDFSQFIEDIYSSDTVPWEHLQAKTKYLIGGACYIGLLKNHNPEEVMVGEGEYRHIQCMLINRFKWQVREQLNPVINGERSEQHVIHCSDYESQVNEFWHKRKFRQITNFVSSPSAIVKLPFHLPPLTRFEVVQTDIAGLLAKEMTDGDNVDVLLTESIYYKYVLGDKKPYEDYWNKFKGTRLHEDKSPSAYDKLIERFDEAKVGSIVVSNGVIWDGNHRASILLSKGKNLWPIMHALDPTKSLKV